MVDYPTSSRKIDYQMAAYKIAAAKYAHQQSTQIVFEKLRKYISAETINQVIDEAKSDFEKQIHAMTPEQIKAITVNEIFAALQPGHNECHTS